MMKNKITILQFSTSAILKVDKNDLASKINKLNEKLDALIEEREKLEYDLDSIKNAVRAASKLSTDESPSKEEKEDLSDLKENYFDFLNSDSEEEQGNGSSLLNKIMSVKRYIVNELKTNEGSTNKLISSMEDVQSNNKGKEPLHDDNNKGKQPIYESNIIEKGESSKRKLDSDDSEQSSSKKSKQSTTDFIDNLPYNPFDDIGTD